MDKEGLKTKKITETLLKKFPNKQWVIDAGSLQVMETKFIPPNAILTPNEKEFEMLFKTKASPETVLAGLAVAMAAENPPFLAACAGAYLTKKSAELLHQRVGFAYNADDLAEEVPRVLGQSWR